MIIAEQLCRFSRCDGCFVALWSQLSVHHHGRRCDWMLHLDDWPYSLHVWIIAAVSCANNASFQCVLSKLVAYRQPQQSLPAPVPLLGHAKGFRRWIGAILNLVPCLPASMYAQRRSTCAVRPSPRRRFLRRRRSIVVRRLLHQELRLAKVPLAGDVPHEPLPSRCLPHKFPLDVTRSCRF